MEQNNRHKSIVRQFYINVIGQQDIAYANRILADDYIQHNPVVPSGKENFIAFLEILKTMPKTESDTKPTAYLMAEGELVMGYFKLSFAGQQKLVLDLFRIENGLLAEHWDVIQDIPSDYNLSEINAMETIKQTDKMYPTTQNKQWIKRYHQEVLQQQQYDQINNFVSTKIVLHAPNTTQGITQWLNHQKGIVITETHKILAEDDMVMTQCTGLIAEEKHVIYAVYRLSNTKIVEQWSIAQVIPEQMMHDNGMI